MLPLVTDTIRVAEAVRAAAMSRYQSWCRKQPPATVERFRRFARLKLFSSPVLSGKDVAGQFLLRHEHAHYLPTAVGDERRRVTQLTVYARGGFAVGEFAALTGLRQVAMGDRQLRVQLIGLGQPADFRSGLFGGAAGAERIWVSATPYLGPEHVGRTGRERHLRKALRRELRRWVLPIELMASHLTPAQGAAPGTASLDVGAGDGGRDRGGGDARGDGPGLVRPPTSFRVSSQPLSCRRQWFPPPPSAPFGLHSRPPSTVRSVWDMLAITVSASFLPAGAIAASER